jgi:hypothetical protein
MTLMPRDCFLGKYSADSPFTHDKWADGSPQDDASKSQADDISRLLMYDTHQ